MKARHRGPEMASLDNTFVYGPSFLTEDDIPRSSLNGRDPNQLKNSETLESWPSMPRSHATRPRSSEAAAILELGVCHSNSLTNTIFLVTELLRKENKT